MEHREPDRVPLDGWFTAKQWEHMKSYFSVQDLGRVREVLGIDNYEVYMGCAESFKEKAKILDTHLWEYVIPHPNGLYEDEWGIKYRIGGTGNFWHYAEHPLQNAESIDHYIFPEIDAPGRFIESEGLVKKWRDTFAISGGYLQLFLTAWALRGYREFIRDMYMNPSFVNSLLDRILNFRVEQGKRFIEIGADVVCLADDIGVQNGMMISPQLWRKFLKPRMRRMIHELKVKKDVYIFYHSDGFIEPVIPDLIEIGVDILNPIQPECMNPAEIKRKYGNKLTLHGTISLQETLARGSVEDVRNEVLERIWICGEGGGFILSPSNRITPDIPFKNVLTVYETAKKASFNL